MRRMAAVLHHRQAGFSANAMGAWVVPPERQDHFGAIAAGFAAVSHCYRRPTYPDWPYSLFTMVHARDRAGCERTLAQIAAATGIERCTALYSSHEYKKVRVRYMTDEISRWEAAALAGAGPV
jgi:DNA-binding Lrp family transcriptional regulator